MLNNLNDYQGKKMQKSLANGDRYQNIYCYEKLDKKKRLATKLTSKILLRNP
ncbi:MAG: hypothetical protein RLZZ574_1174 [Cyanobacteriota bacterium]